MAVALGMLLVSTGLAAAAPSAPPVAALASSPAPATVGVLDVQAFYDFVPKLASAPIVEKAPEIAPPTPVDIAMAPPPCPFGPPENLGLSPNAARAYLAVCALFPDVTAFGGLRPGDWGDHGTGRAVDCMISSDVGDAISEFVLAHADTFGVEYVIWKQRIRYPGGDWQFMEDRGSATENHYDHVHISFS